MGLSMGSIFIVYTATSIAQVFFITAATFGALSLYGYTTKRDLTAVGSFMFMGLIGIIIALLQALTQVQEVTLTFIPKIIVILLVSSLTAPFVGSVIYSFAEMVYSRIEVGF